MNRANMVSGVALLVCTAAFPHARAAEVLYLADTLEPGTPSRLFQVHLDPLARRADLMPLADVGFGPGVIPLDQVGALAASPDGLLLYAVDTYGGASTGTGELGVYQVEPPYWHIVGDVMYEGERLRMIVQAACSPDGTLYVASSDTDLLYVVDTGTAEATLVGDVVNQVSGVALDVYGADMVFAADGTLYFWTNRSRRDAPLGLYILSLPTVYPGTVAATYVGSGTGSPRFTGAALTSNGAGELVFSTADDEILLVDRGSATTMETFHMFLDGEPYDYTFGDMSVGPLFVSDGMRLDIKPGSCPNPFNVRSRGVVPVAVLGSGPFDVADIDRASLMLGRADGTGGTVTPLAGPPGPGMHLEDVATPFRGEPCGCHETDADGFDDLVLKFSARELTEVLELHAAARSDSITLSVSGFLLDGTEFEVSDCIVLVGSRKSSASSANVSGLGRRR